MDTLSQILKDIEAGIRQGIEVFREKATVVKEKAEELTEEGKRQYAIYELKGAVHKDLAGVGARVYQLHRDRKIRLSDKELLKVIDRIAKSEASIAVLEGKPSVVRKAPKKTAAKKPAGAKASVAFRKTAVKKAVAKPRKTTKK
ncbi:MAG TPA: hypothetical protein VK445_12350 [Dissulfurispiraceae bacterium]|nr:hypothetical protein [Dissulfurispiraceae bacterium]